MLPKPFRIIMFILVGILAVSTLVNVVTLLHAGQYTSPALYASLVFLLFSAGLIIFYLRSREWSQTQVRNAGIALDMLLFLYLLISGSIVFLVVFVLFHLFFHRRMLGFR